MDDYSVEGRVGPMVSVNEVYVAWYAVELTDDDSERFKMERGIPEGNWICLDIHETPQHILTIHPRTTQLTSSVLGR